MSRPLSSRQPGAVLAQEPTAWQAESERPRRPPWHSGDERLDRAVRAAERNRLQNSLAALTECFEAGSPSPADALQNPALPALPARSDHAPRFARSASKVRAGRHGDDGVGPEPGNVLLLERRTVLDWDGSPLPAALWSAKETNRATTDRARDARAASVSPAARCASRCGGAPVGNRDHIEGTATARGRRRAARAGAGSRRTGDSIGRACQRVCVRVMVPFPVVGQFERGAASSRRPFLGPVRDAS